MSSGLAEGLVRENVDLLPFNTLRLPARARFFATATSRDGLISLLQWARDLALPWLVLGGGSNLVLRDDFPGLVIRMALRGRVWCDVEPDTAVLSLEAGENWHDSVIYAAQTGFRGIENLALIPGTVGAAPVQNIGAYGVELADTLVDVEVLDTHSLTFKRLSRKQCQFAYRDSLFKKDPERYVITRIRLGLSRTRDLVLNYQGLGDALGDIQQQRLTPLKVARGVMAIRRSKLPDPQVLPNAGSFFKNPVVSQDHYQRLKQSHPGLVAYPAPATHGAGSGTGMKLAAGWLIDQCGWKGYHDAHVGVHRQQALVLVNHTNGTGRDILHLAERIQADVRERYDVGLEIEPRLVP